LRTPVHGTVRRGAASASSIEHSSGSDFINQKWRAVDTSVAMRLDVCCPQFAGRSVGGDPGRHPHRPGKPQRSGPAHAARPGVLNRRFRVVVVRVI